MPDIGLLQGPPRPRLVVVDTSPAPSDVRGEPIPLAPAGSAVPPVEAVEVEIVKVAAHAAVVSEDAPVAVLRATPDALPAAMRDEAAPVEHPAAGIPVPSLPEASMVPPVTGVPSVVAPSVGASSSPEQPAPALPAADRPPPPAAMATVTPLPVRAVPAPAPPILLRDLLWLLLALALIVGTGLGVRDPWPADEPRFASLARDMAQTGEWLFPRVGGDLYQDKPPLFFWLLALGYTLFGSIKASFLLPSLLAAAGVLFLLYDLGRRTVGREAGLAAAIATLCSLQFVLAFRGAQIDPVLCLLTTFSLYALSRHLLLGDGWRWYFLGGFAAGLGVITKGVGFLPILALVPYFLLRRFGWRGLATPEAGRGGWRWWLAPLAMLVAISLWFVPMLLVVDQSNSPEYAAYRDEILFKQTVGRYAAAWHHVKGWHYFLAEVIPALWLPWSLLLFWLVPRFKAAWIERDARVWLPLGWVLLVLSFFTLSPGKRGIYILPALPALAMAALPLLPAVLARRGVRIAGWVLALLFWLAGVIALLLLESGLLHLVTDADLGGLQVRPMLIAFVVAGGAGLLWARARASLAAWPAILAALCVAFSYFLAPLMNGERSGRDFVRSVLAQVQPREALGLVAYKEQFLLYLDRPTVNFGHRRWQEGPQEYFDAAAWLDAAPDRVLLVPEEALAPKNRFDRTQPAIPCFTVNARKVGTASDDDWYLVRAPAEPACAALGDASRAIPYPAQP